MSTIYLSFPVNSPDAYKNNKTSWAQITYFIHKALAKEFPGRVKYLRYGTNIPMKKEDVLISCIPNDQLGKMPERSIIIDNDNFEVNKWKHGKFRKYGLEAQTDLTSPFDKYLKGLYGAVFKTNDVAIKKWESDNSDVKEKKDFLLKHIQHVELVPHPIDKDHFSKFYRPQYKAEKLRMLVYNAPWRKNAVQLVKMLRRNNFSTDSYAVISSMNKSDNEVRKVLNKFAYLAHVSYSEGFPYFANEFLCQGLVLYGHEEWWDPYNHEELAWTYEPARQEKNLANLRKLLSNDFKDQYYKMRNEVVGHHLARKDNDWNHLNKKLIKMVNELLG